jgi:hypothetical protein
MILESPFWFEKGHLGTSVDHHHIQTGDYYHGYYPVGNAFTHRSFGSFFGTRQDTQQLPVNHLLQIPTVICFPILIELLQATTHIFFGEYMCFSHCLSNPLYQTSYIT